MLQGSLPQSSQSYAPHLTAPQSHPVLTSSSPTLTSPFKRCRSYISRMQLGRRPIRAAAAAEPAKSASQPVGAPSKAAVLRLLLAAPEILEAPACFDGLSARLIQQAGFRAGFLSGFSVAAARAGAPDTGLLSYAEVLDSARCAVEGAPGIPIIADGDTGYGNALNVKRTVRGFAAAGCAGVLIEDQEWPKSCGHVAGKRVVSREEAVARVRAACDARDSGADIVVFARTDARQAVGLEEAFWRAQAFAEAGADVLFIDALGSLEEVTAFGALGGTAAGLPRMANNLEGGGRTPLLPPGELQQLGFAVVAYPLSLIGTAAAAMRAALDGLRQGRVPPSSALPPFREIQTLFGFDDYFAEAAHYAVRPAAVGETGKTPAAAAEREK
eukprot:CAMPEP_0206149744 /NCGR_PEP_ID=MMETSP1473-20131121/37942_1 /ASSEMBLY_ACC=CAM_ASM_001109 /TAXON_ID=1461547 /ORGANISM="Stichococcus sp, Strain RCC1054" /LENGTH=384 /DNA_ID=CAMNT_0053547225 /DNA_START=195 /DNA_END=1349 /DNA_ORIENTATION=+